MGDRANIYLTTETDATRGIYLYTHWNGCEWPELLRKALSKQHARRRWDDESYLSRILILELFSDLAGSETGGGVSTSITDNEYPITVVDLQNQVVAFATPGSEVNSDAWVGHMKFSEYVAQPTAEYPLDVRRW